MKSIIVLYDMKTIGLLRIVSAVLIYRTCKNKSLLWEEKARLVENRGFLYFSACLVYKCLNDSAPIYLSNNFQYLSQYHDYSTHSVGHNNLVLPRPNISLYTHSFKYQGTNIWNNLSITVRSCCTLNKFKYDLKQHILNAVK